MAESHKRKVNDVEEESKKEQRIEVKKEGISEVEYFPCENSKYIKTKRMVFSYTKDGVTRKQVWDIVESHDAVAIVLYHEVKKSFLMVKQFRPVVWHRSTPQQRENPECGYTYEFCAGLVDKNKSLVEIVQEEIIEECGYKVEQKDITRIASCRGNVGITGNLVTLYYAKINESMKVGEGGGIRGEGEYIDLIWIPISEAMDFLFDDAREKPPSVSLGITWFFQKISPTLS